MDKEPNGYKCVRCAITLTGRRTKYCSAFCHDKDAANRAPPIVDVPVEQRRKGPYTSVCKCCHKVFIYRPSGTEIRTNHQRVFCSMACRTKMSQKMQSELAAIKKIGANIRAIKQKAEALRKKIAAKLSLPPHQCATCGAGLSGHRCKKYCSKDCKPKKTRDKTTPAYRASKKAWRLKRKAIERGAATAVKFNPYDIFNRDGWICQICGIKTPESLRGTYKPNAPELDHIIPLSKGGAHHPSNCQTSCRSCNGSKADGMPVGQIGLFTSLIAA